MKIIKQIALIILLLPSTYTFAQESVLSNISTAEIEQYIALAKQNYAKRKVKQAMTESVKTGISAAQASYFDIFNVSYIYRPENKAVIDPLNPYNINGFQLGININIGSLIQKPFIVKKAKAEYKVAQLEALDFDNELMLEVKKRYYDYIEQKTQLKIITQSALDSKGVAESLRDKFEKGSITLDVYNESRITQSEATTIKIQTEITYLKAKDLLEEIIGEKIATGK